MRGPSRAAFAHALAAATLALPLVPRRAWADDALAPLRLASSADGDVAPVLYAVKAGWFKDAGLDAQISALANGTAVAAAIVGGSIDIGKASLLSVINAHARGLNFAIVAPTPLANVAGDYDGFLVLKDGGIRSARDLNGKTVAVPALHDLQSLATQTWIDKNGGDAKTIAFVEAPASAVGVALDSGRVAAGVLTNPALAHLMVTGKYVSLGKPIEEAFNGAMPAAWVATPDWVSKNVSVVQRFGQVVAKADTFATAHPDQLIDVIADFSKIDRATLTTMTRSVFPANLSPALVQPFIDAAARYGAIPKGFPASELFSPSAYGYKH